MSKKRQVTFQKSTAGKFIPRDEPPAASVFRSGVNNTRFNSKMAELLASASTSNNENEPTQSHVKTSADDPILSPPTETTLPDSSRVQSKLIQRRVATMLESLRGRGASGESASPLKTPVSNVELKPQPITFGQLRQATATATSSPLPPPPSQVTPSTDTVDDISASKVLLSHSPNRQPQRPNVLVSSQADFHADLPSSPINPTRISYSSSLEQLLEHHNVVPRINETNESKPEAEQRKSSLTVDEILATYYAKLRIPATTESHMPSLTITSSPPSYSSNNSNLHLQPTTLGWTPSPPLVPSLVFNEQNRNRPPPPSYSSAVAPSHQPPSSTNQLAQHLFRLPTPFVPRDHVYSVPQITQHLSPAAAAVRPALPQYEAATITNVERSHSALSSMNQPNFLPANPPQAGFDPEFSRLLYGKEEGRNRRQRQKRKAFSDPVKKSVEEASQTAEKARRRLTTNLNKTDTVKEEEETSSDSYEIDKHDQKQFLQKYMQPQSDKRELIKTPIVPPNPILARRIPSFLKTYCQGSLSPNYIPPQWHLCSLYKLQSYEGMMTKLYKDENLSRVKLYETYRALLASVLAMKTSSNQSKKHSVERHNYDSDNITTTAL
ncbi:unnamed protein product [Adineta ricciae]|uniref:Uncharacterized protein n=1 Tax=Adineta ricciae TaxID=249248 RepID=A0A813ST33_ADIRI|nr:unnamed protein product [Adineta ricciae]CAF1001901.1 unnamed protein product [Adineta ricciae]